MEKGQIEIFYIISGTWGKFWKKMAMIQGKYFQTSAKSFLKKMSLPNGNGDQIIFYINSNCVFSKTFEEEKLRSPMEKGRIEFFISFLEPRGKFRTMAMFKYVFT